ncbi:hypothetical protein P280DRAFT_471535 [Massarina eburnea CBS 473.64]|uniref:Uncharacterized protein n=1 Tax=Massarina eburnea CBS 473.64 TaxID=1395130 RepID=A0A6A6RTC5_9PLEO|nr:hypothetical protein P280DRAFT_471535 [Massarina eburnea CBS 473.64]
MSYQTPKDCTIHEPPTPIPSPPPLIDSFARATDNHYVFTGAETRLGHHLFAHDSSNPGPAPRDWKLRLQANFLPTNGGGGLFSLRNFPEDLVPFFAYKDVAIYMPTADSVIDFFDAVYREWYPTRDRTVFDNGLMACCGAPFFSSTMRVVFEDPGPQPPGLLNHLVDWHVALSQHLHRLIPRFHHLKIAARMLISPGLTQPQLDALPVSRVRVEYKPIIRRTFSECFLWVEKGWIDKGVRLVVLSKDMSNKILSGECEGLTRDMDLEERAIYAAGSGARNEEEEKKVELEDHVNVNDAETTMGHVSVWRGSLEHVMRAVVAGEETRKRGLREYNFVLGEWLGEGVNVGK